MIETGSSQPRNAWVVLLGSGFLFWALLLIPAWLVAADRGVIGLTLASALCLAPGVIAFALKAWVGSQSGLVLAANGLRLGFVLIGALAVRYYWRDLGLNEFFVWLVFNYLYVLSVETWLTVRRSA